MQHYSLGRISQKNRLYKRLKDWAIQNGIQPWTLSFCDERVSLTFGVPTHPLAVISHTVNRAPHWTHAFLLMISFFVCFLGGWGFAPIGNVTRDSSKSNQVHSFHERGIYTMPYEKLVWANFHLYILVQSLYLQRHSDVQFHRNWTWKRMEEATVAVPRMILWVSW